ncbi:hypothetical protein [Acinetobacter guillouiae]|uniref:hypothetical protein n=1 Tax=Acinetobacter guillouiae TaxID=106649 RepID=UPI0032B359EB
MKKHIIAMIFLAGLSNIANAGDPISDEDVARAKPFCTKISGHAHTIMAFSFDRKRTKDQIAQSLNQSAAQPYWSNETKQWLKDILNTAYKKEWSSTNYQRPYNAQINISSKDYATNEFQEVIYERCLYNIYEVTNYCSKKALKDSKDASLSRNYRAKLNGLCY